MNYLQEQKHHYGVYLRISKEKDKQDTFENHMTIVKQYMEQGNHTYETFNDIISGKTIERPELNNLLNRLDEFTAIFVIHLDRISRNGELGFKVKQLLKGYQLPLHTPYQKLDLSIPMDSKMYDDSISSAEYERNTMSLRRRYNMKTRIQRGEWIGSKVPYGYIRNASTRRLEVDKTKAETIRLIYKLYLEGNGTQAIRTYLNLNKIPTVTGTGQWIIITVRKILSNPAYRGDTVFKEWHEVIEKSKGFMEPKNRVKEEFYIPNTHEAIINPSEWDRVQSMMESKTKQLNIRERKARDILPLKDLLVCAIDGCKMVYTKISKDSDKYVYKKCRGETSTNGKCQNAGIDEMIVRTAVLDELKKHKDNYKQLLQQMLNNDFSSIINDKQQTLSQYEKHLHHEQVQKERLLDLALQGLFTSQEIANKKAEIESNINILEGKIKSLQKDLEATDVTNIQSQYERYVDVLDNIEKKPTAEINKKLKTIIKCIRYSRIMPEDIAKLGVKVAKRKYYPFKIKIEFID
ncbi:recombinase family protein [Gottfriedia acidiceleris]|uniref:Recombinase family protein n=1 Tax=Gottfriedia acidiceleris TaxID=371036 RepID=A0ABY4JJW1_9BACI|nr:recombinase family protein [Gottfriedia acidiceleris]UPM53108.1 recombinase family protein [Gottfriedia acidiceleris]